MNDERQRRLMRAARRVPAVAPSQDFCADVLRAIRAGDGAARPARPATLADQLAALLPKLAVAAAIIIVAAVAWEYFTGAGFISQLAQASSDEWLWAAEPL
jgi:hypothetical protein